MKNFQREVFLVVLQDESPRIQSGGENNAMGPREYFQGSRICKTMMPLVFSQVLTQFARIGLAQLLSILESASFGPEAAMIRRRRIGDTKIDSGAVKSK